MITPAPGTCVLCDDDGNDEHGNPCPVCMEPAEPMIIAPIMYAPAATCDHPGIAEAQADAERRAPCVSRFCCLRCRAVIEIAAALPPAFTLS